MKMMRDLLLAGVMPLFCYSIGNAQIIYSNNFTLGDATDIGETAPTVANNYAGGTSSATWNDVLGINDTNSSGSLFFGKNGSVPGTPDSLLLPFTPQSGYVYTLTASVTFTGNPGNWVGLGFAQNNNVNVLNGYGRFSDSSNGGPNGYDWIILTEASGNAQYFAGPHGTGQIIGQNGFFAANNPGTHTVKIVLDTTGVQWAITTYVDGVQAGTNYTYANYPPIGAVGITETSLGTPTNVQWNYLTLTAVGSPPTTNTSIIYSNNFTLGEAANIDGTTPTVANNYAGGTIPATWNDVLGTNNTGALLANGVNTTTTGDSWLLPFVPQSGYIYTLTGSLTFTNNPGSWVGLGFAQSDPNDLSGSARFSDPAVTGYDWMILTEANENVQYFAGPRGSSPIYNANNTFTGGPQTLTAQVVLNTIGSQWTITAYVNGVQMGSNANYGNYPPISAVGITQNSLGAPNAIHWNDLTLTAVGSGPATNTIKATISFSPTNTGLPLNPAFGGVSYEKLEMTHNFFASNNIPLVKLFSMVGPAVLRVGGGTVDQTGWGGISNTIPITAQQVDTFAGFIKALPTNWSVIYGINLLSNTPANCAAEATYAANALGSRLLGFEIGNEPEFGFSSYNAFLAAWRPLAAAITNTVPGWAITNGGNGWALVGADAGQGQLAAYTDKFANDESGKVSILTQHYYRAAGGSTNDTMQYLFQPDPFLRQLTTNIVTAATGHCPLGARITECGSYSEGGVANVSDAFGAALWSLDFMFTVALDGGQGINFHGGGKSPYSPLTDDGTNVTTVGPGYYGLKMFSLIPPGKVIPATVTPASNTNFTAYGVRQVNGTISALLNNKDMNDTMAVSVNLGTNVIGAQLIELTGPSLYITSGYTLGGAAINTDGSWNGGVQTMLSATNGLVTVSVPPASAFLLKPVISPSNITVSMAGNQLSLSWPVNFSGWILQSNSTSLMSTNWFSIPGSSNTNRAQITIQPGLTNVFYRLSPP